MYSVYTYCYIFVLHTVIMYTKYIYIMYILCIYNTVYITDIFYIL